MCPSKLSDLTFVLLFDQDVENFSLKPNSVYYVLPGSEIHYDNPLAVIDEIITKVIDALLCGAPPAGSRRGVIQCPNKLPHQVIVDWGIRRLEYYDSKGINMVANKYGGTWTIWGQNYFNSLCHKNPMVPRP